MHSFNDYGINERFLTEAAKYPEYQLARVVAQYRGKYKVATAHGEALAQISGKMRFDTEELSAYPAVGDFVMISSQDGYPEAIIHHILTRKSLFVRKAVGVSGQAQPVAANIDTVFLCMSLNQNYNLNRMERYLSIAWDSGAVPVISSFSDVVTLSMFDTNITEKLAPYFFKNQTCAFIGSSGVGKSTIINRLLGEEALATREIGKADRGRHTTTGRELFPCPLGGVVIDTPGMREMGADSADLSKAFQEIEELATQCKFRDCTHTSEPGCAILAAVADGRTDNRRLARSGI